jgi:hypothetical protein
MARTLHRLSAVAVAGAKTAGYFADGGNLYLRVAVGASNGKKKPPARVGFFASLWPAERVTQGLVVIPPLASPERAMRLTAAGD